MFFVFLCILYEETVPYRTVLQYYSITVTVYHFGIAIEVLLYI